MTRKDIRYMRTVTNGGMGPTGGFTVSLVAAIWAAAIWFAVEGDWRSGPGEVSLRPEPQDMRDAATGLYGLGRVPGYTGPVAKIQRDADKWMLDVGSVSDMRQFCAYTTCVVLTMYDQSGNGAHMHKVAE